MKLSSLVLLLWSCLWTSIALPFSTKSVRAYRVTSREQLIQGEVAQGQIGDYILENKRIKVLIAQPQKIAGGYGGNIWDAIYKPTGEDDQLGRIELLIEASQTPAYKQVQIVKDGSDGEAVIRAQGELGIHDQVVLRLVAYTLGLRRFPYTTDKLPLLIRTEYILKKGEEHISITTELLNIGSLDLYLLVGEMLFFDGKMDVFLADTKGGFGGVFLEKASFAAATGRGVSYGYFRAGGEPFLSMQSQNSVIALPPLDPLAFLTKPRQRMLLVPAHHSAFFKRIFWIGDGSVSRIRDSYNAFFHKRKVLIHGSVREEQTAKPLPGAHVVFVGPQPRQTAYTHFLTDGKGHFSGTVTPGKYEIRAKKKGRVGSRQTLEIGEEEKQPIRLLLPQTSTFSFTIRNEKGYLIPSRLTVVGVNPDPPETLFWDSFWDNVHPGIAFFQYSPNGKGRFALPPGKYRFVASHGPLFSLEEKQFTLKAGKGKKARFVLRQILNPNGMLSADFHVHSIHSWDSKVSLRERVTTFAAEGLDVLVSTDHFYITDYAPSIRSLHLEKSVASLPGQELSFSNIWHFNAFPLRHDPDSPNGGAINPGSPFGEFFIRSPREVFEATRQNFPRQDIGVLQVNHPYARAGGLWPMGYFEIAGLCFDLQKNRAKSCKPLAPKHLLRIRPSQKMLDTSFDVLEVYNGRWDWVGSAEEVAQGRKMDPLRQFFKNLPPRQTDPAKALWAWFNFLRIGKRVTAVGNTDTHSQIYDIIGYPRTFVKSSNRKIDKLNVAEFTRNIKAGRVFVSNAPLINLTARAPSTGAEGSLGDTIQTEDGKVLLTISLQTPSYAPLDKIEIYKNPDLPERVEELRPDFTSYAYRILPIKKGEWKHVKLKNGGMRLEWEKTLPLEIEERKAFVVFRITGKHSLFPLVPYKMKQHTLKEWIRGEFENEGVGPLLLTNPIFVERINR